MARLDTIAYFGPPGTFTHMAARSVFGIGATYVESSTILGVFDSVSRGVTTYGVVPIENSTEGSVTFTLDSLLESDVAIRSEIVLEVTQCLLGRHDDVGKISRVCSHPQALAQCRNWLSRTMPDVQVVDSPSTSAAAREAAEDDAAAAIASRLAAELYGLRVMRDGIQDRAENATRFIVLAQSDAPRTGNDKTTIVFSTPDVRGALYRVLEIFDEERINLSHIHSRPRNGCLWEYVFFTDLVGHRTDPGVARALERLAGRCEMVRILGSYPAIARTRPSSGQTTSETLPRTVRDP